MNLQKDKVAHSKILNRWFVVLGAVMIQLSLGAIYAWSVFTPSLKNAGWSKVDTQWVFSLGLVSFALVMVFAGKKLNSWGPRRLAILGGLTLGAGYIIAGLLGGTSFWFLLIFIGLIGGAGIGLGYVVPISVGMQWFPDKKGMITGLAVAGFGFGALLWIYLAGSWGHLIVKVGLSNTFLIYGIAFMVLVLIGGVFMVYPPEGWKPEGWIESTDNKVTSESIKEFTNKEMLKTPQFYIIFFTFLFSASAGLMAIGLMKLYPMEALQQNGLSAIKASAIAGTAMAVFYSLANTLGRIGWGVISDKIGRKKSVIILTGIQGIVVILFTLMAGTTMLLYFGAALIGFNFGGNFALFPSLTADIFGTKNVGNNYPFIFLAYGAGGVIGPIMGGIMGDMGSFSTAFIISGIACLCVSVLMMFLKTNEPR